LENKYHAAAAYITGGNRLVHHAANNKQLPMIQQLQTINDNKYNKETSMHGRRFETGKKSEE